MKKLINENVRPRFLNFVVESDKILYITTAVQEENYPET